MAWSSQDAAHGEGAGAGTNRSRDTLGHGEPKDELLGLERGFQEPRVLPKPILCCRQRQGFAGLKSHCLASVTGKISSSCTELRGDLVLGMGSIHVEPAWPLHRWE